MIIMITIIMFINIISIIIHIFSDPDGSPKRRRGTNKIHLLRLRTCLTQTPNLEILSLKIGRIVICYIILYYIVLHKGGGLSERTD